MNNFTVAKDRDGFYVVLDPWGYTVKRPEDAAKIRSEQLPIYFRTEVAALAAARKFQAAEEERSRQEAETARQNSRARIDRMDNEAAMLRQSRENRNALACSTRKVQELSGEIVTTEREIRTLEATISALEGQLAVNRIDVTVSKAKLASLQGALKDAKGEIK